MTQSDLDSVAILVAVDNPEFANALVQILRSFAPMPVEASVTNSLTQALLHLETTDVDLILIDAFLPDSRGAVTLTRLRQRSSVPAIVIARSLTRDVEQHMIAYGAQAVLARETLNPVSLIEGLQQVLKESSTSSIYRRSAIGKSNGSPSENEVTTDTHQSLAGKDRLTGAARLHELLSGQQLPADLQKQKLRKLLFKFNNKP